MGKSVICNIFPFMPLTEPSIKMLGAIMVLMWFCNYFLVNISRQSRVCSTRGALDRLLSLFCSGAQSWIISVEHVLRPGCSLLYFIIFYFFILFYFILLYFNSPRGVNSKDFVQFIFLHSSRETKSKDFLQLTIMIFLLWISFKNMRKSVFCHIPFTS